MAELYSWSLYKIRLLSALLYLQILISLNCKPKPRKFFFSSPIPPKKSLWKAYLNYA